MTTIFGISTGLIAGMFLAVLDRRHRRYAWYTSVILIVASLMAQLIYGAYRQREDKMPAPEEIVYQANELMKSYDYANAASKFTEAINSGADEVVCLRGRAESYFYLKKYEEAELDATRLLSLGDRTGRAWLIRGMISEKSGNKTKAIQEYEIGTREGDRFAARRLNTILSRE